MLPIRGAACVKRGPDAIKAGHISRLAQSRGVAGSSGGLRVHLPHLEVSSPHHVGYGPRAGLDTNGRDGGNMRLMSLITGGRTGVLLRQRVLSGLAVLGGCH